MIREVKYQIHITHQGISTDIQFSDLVKINRYSFHYIFMASDIFFIEMLRSFRYIRIKSYGVCFYVHSK